MHAERQLVPAREWEGLHQGWHFRWYRDWSSVWAELEAEWRLMIGNASSPTPYHLPDYVRAWSRTIGSQNVSPLVGVFHHRAGHKVLLPWVVVRHDGRFVERRVLEYAGRELSGYQSPIVVRTPGESLNWNEFWQTVQIATEGECDKGLMRYVRSDQAPNWSQPMREGAPVLDLTSVASLEDLLARCSQNHRVDVRRRLRRLRERGSVELWVASSDDYASVVTDLRQGFLVQHAIICDEKAYPNPFGGHAAQSFLESLFEAGLRDGWAFFGALRVDGESIAWVLALVHDGEFYWWRPAYDTEWRSFSPGKVLLALTLEHAIARGWKKVHFHAGDQPYKLAWKPDLPSMSSVSWYPRGIRSSTLALYDRLSGPR